MVDAIASLQGMPEPSRLQIGENGNRFLAVLVDIAGSLRRMAEVQPPMPKDKAGTTYVAERLGYTTEYVSQLARDGIIPPSCIVSGTGNGKQWKFYRERIDAWIERR